MSIISSVLGLQNAPKTVSRGVRAAWAQINPADGNRTWDTTQRGVAPSSNNGSSRPQASKPQTQPQETAPSGGGSGGGSGSGGSGGGGSSSDPVTAAYYDDLAGRLKGFLGGIDGQRQQGLDKISDQYNRDSSRLNEGYGQTKRDIGIKREEASTDKLKTVSKIDANVANTADSFRRLVGMGHAGNSSFAKDFVPTATARQGSEQRGEAFDTFGRNARKLDLTEKDADGQYENNKEDLLSQRKQAEYGLESGVITQRQEIIDRLNEALFNSQLARGGSAESVKAALAPYSAQATDSMNKLQALFAQYRNPVFNVKPVSVDIPDIEQYIADPLVAALTEQNPGVSQQDLPYLPGLKRRTEEATV